MYSATTEPCWMRKLTLFKLPCTLVLKHSNHFVSENPREPQEQSQLCHAYSQRAARIPWKSTAAVREESSVESVVNVEDDGRGSVDGSEGKDEECWLGGEAGGK